MPFKFFSKEGFERVTALANQDVELDYVQITSPPAGITATTEGTAVVVLTGNSKVYDGLTKVKIQLFLTNTNQSSGGAQGYFLVLRDSTVIGRISGGYNGNSANFPIFGEVYDTPPAGAHIYKIAAFTSAGILTITAGSGGAGNYLPAFLRVSSVTQQVTTFPEAVMEVDDGDVPVWDSASQSWKGERPRVAGVVNADGTIARGSGFTSSKIGTGSYQIVFSTPFPTIPVVVATGAGDNCQIKGFSAGPTVNGFTIQTFLNLTNSDAPFQFEAVEYS